MPAKIVVKAYRGGSRVSLLGSSGKELLTSSVFQEPRAKGATLRALKGLLGEDVVIEDHTLASAKAGTSKTATPKTISPKTEIGKAVAATAVAATKAATVVTAPAKKVGAKAGSKPAARRSTRTSKATADK